MKKTSVIVLFVAICWAASSHAQGAEKTDPLFVFADVLVYRPLGLAVTAAGIGLFVAMIPLTALASIPEPHDAFKKMARILVEAPAAYTFTRPLGDRGVSVGPPAYLRKPRVVPPAQPKPSAPAPSSLPKPPLGPETGFSGSNLK